ncbi:OHCU decarboxylase [Agromyces terreus]|uniref:2-oxo-4-hydroxy-4-carboxy-5-ureidoimidazoline decarboxylase n=1 Tax=Agromyces terreus TaxID=424795 RepID=A0A9X2KAG9_9MICO|nr:2-oxo-4-hydroxy-4-carboxy-5-ureidoimidazoline decarboxylase [Agromyces terreus]MCP2369534.1 OHCU decarboxylase [Agromyces terreus]
MSATTVTAVDAFNSMDRDEAIALLRPCVDVDRWCEELADARPFVGTELLLAAAELAASPFTADEVEQALAHHPRIGERATGAHREAALSRSEQAGIDQTDADVAAALVEGNLAYERRFGRVFLIRAAGRSASEILAALNERLGNSDAEEAAVVADQLRQIAVLRLKGIFAP